MALSRQVGARITGTANVLIDLVLPGVCAGCGREGSGQLCDDCRIGLAGLVPTATTPTPSPPGLPPCVALGGYEGPLRGILLSYKERGAHRLARPLGQHLARAVATAVEATYPVGTPIVLIPVPSTAQAIRERYGDHMSRIAVHVARTLQRAQWPAGVSQSLFAKPKADSSHLSASERIAAAADAFRIRSGAARRVIVAQRAGAAVIVIDDILTTGATMASVATVLRSYGVYTDGVATIAATRRRNISTISGRLRDTRPDVRF